jgi:D-threo-aldose 1-dehydrogenase
VMNAAVYGGGLLTATPAGKASSTYGYRPARPELLAAADAMRAACRRNGVDLATAALAFSLGDPRIATTVVGISKASRVQPLVEAAAFRMPADLSDELNALVPDRSAWLDG